MLWKKQNKMSKKNIGQAITEFALALPVTLLIVFGVIEFGYLLFVYSSVNSASREAARYGIAIGDVSGGGKRYYDCNGIEDAGLKIGQFAGMTAADITIGYDRGPGTTYPDPEYPDCATLAADNGRTAWNLATEL